MNNIWYVCKDGDPVARINFGPSYHVMNINGTMIFNGGTFFLEDSIRTLYVNSIDSSRPALFQTRPGTTLDGVPGIQAYVYSLVKAEGTSGQECSWRFRPRYGDRFHAGFDIYNRFEADYTTFQGSTHQQDSCLWGGIFVGDVQSSILMDHCTVRDIFIDDSLHGTAIHLYGSTNQNNRISHCTIYRKNLDNPYAGDGIILQANGQHRSYAILDSNCVSERWWTGEINVSSDQEMKGSKVFGNFVGSSTILGAKTFLHANCFTHNGAQGLSVENNGDLTLQTISGYPPEGDNSIQYNGWIDPGGFQIHRAQIVLQDNAYANRLLPVDLHQGNGIRSDTVKLVYATGASQAYLRKNWWGFVPDGCDPVYGNPDPAKADTIFYHDGNSELFYDNALCDSTSIPECSAGCGEISSITLRSEEMNPLISSTPRWMFSRSQPSTMQTLRNVLRAFRQSILNGAAANAYSTLATLLQTYSNDVEATGFIASSAFHSELDYSRAFPSLIIASMTRLGVALYTALNNASNDTVKSVLREALSFVFASAGDIPSAEQMIGNIRFMHTGNAVARRILWLELLCAMTRRDTLTVHSTIVDMAAAGYSTGRLHAAYAMREGFFRFKSRPTSFPKLSLALSDTIHVIDNRQASSSPLQLLIYPNPSSEITTIQYRVPVDGYIALDIFSVIGIHVSTIFEGYQTAGIHHVEFQANGATGSMPPGLYFCRLRTAAGQRIATFLIR